MCLTPITIDNPYYGKNPNKGYNFLHDCKSQKMKVPCGQCSECIALEQMYMVQRIQMEATKNYLFMGTITYDNEHLPSIETQGYHYNYAKVQHLQDCFQRMRDRNDFGIPFRYIAVTERGGKGGRPHAHCLILFKKEDIGDFYDALTFQEEYKWVLFNAWSINKGSRKAPIYETLSQYRESIRRGQVRRTYDFHYVNPAKTKGGLTDAAFYVLKYMLKDTENSRKIKKAFDYYYHADRSEFETDEEWEQADKELQDEAREKWNHIKNHNIKSLGFGLNCWFNDKDRLIKNHYDEDIVKYLREGIERSINTHQPYAQFYGIENLLTFPLAPYYKTKSFIYTMKDELELFKYRKPEEEIEQRTTSELIKKFNEYERKLHLLSSDEIDQTINEIYDDNL